jgi:hypothetical protein
VSEQTTLALGQRLYDEARAKFEGVIQRVLFDLTDAGAPKDSPALRAALKEAIEGRDKFSRFVGGQLPSEGGTKAIDIGGLFQPAADVVNKLIDSAMTIWQEWRGAKQLRRKTIRTQIEAQRWRAFGDL